MLDQFTSDLEIRDMHVPILHPDPSPFFWQTLKEACSPLAMAALPTNRTYRGRIKTFMRGL